MYEEIVDDLLHGRSVVCDDLHTKKIWRQDLLNAVSGIDCRKVLIVLTTPVEECIRRNAGRQSRLPDTLIHTINHKYEQPTLDEGWDGIVYV